MPTFIASLKKIAEYLPVYISEFVVVIKDTDTSTKQIYKNKSSHTFVDRSSSENT
jgi:hypothetical protein